MTDEEHLFSQTLEAFLTSRGAPCERVPESHQRTPDYRIPFSKRDVLLELKIKSDDPGQIGKSQSILEAGGIASRSKPLRPTNTVSGVISDGAKQMIEYDPETKCHHVLWLHASGHDSYAHEEQLRHTLYGVQRLASLQRPELIHCYFFRESEFWRHRKTLAAAFISRWSAPENITIQLCLNPCYTRKNEFAKAELCQALHDGLLDVEREVDGNQILLMDGVCDRRDIAGVLDYLRSKYEIDDLQPIDLGYHIGEMRVPQELEEDDW